MYERNETRLIVPLCKAFVSGTIDMVGQAMYRWVIGYEPTRYPALRRVTVPLVRDLSTVLINYAIAHRPVLDHENVLEQIDDAAGLGIFGGGR